MKHGKVEYEAACLANNLAAIEHLARAKQQGSPAGRHAEDPPGCDREAKIAEIWQRSQGHLANLTAELGGE